MATAPHVSRAAKRRFASIFYARPQPPLEADEAPPGTVEPWEAVAPVRPDTPHVRAPRFLDLAGELAAAVLIIAGGVLAYGWLPIA